MQARTERFTCVRSSQKQLIYAHWWTVLNASELLDSHSHGRGRWFDPSIAHSKILLFAGKTHYNEGDSRSTLKALSSNRQFSNALIALSKLSDCPSTAGLRGFTLTSAITFTAAYLVT